MTTNTTTETDRRTYLGRSTGHHANGTYVIGPVLIDVVTTQTVRSDGTVCTPSYSVEIDGRHQYGGFAWHLDRTGGRPDAAFLVDLVETTGPRPLVPGEDTFSFSHGHGTVLRNEGTDLVVVWHGADRGYYVTAEQCFRVTADDRLIRPADGADLGPAPSYDSLAPRRFTV